MGEFRGLQWVQTQKYVHYCYECLNMYKNRTKLNGNLQNLDPWIPFLGSGCAQTLYSKSSVKFIGNNGLLVSVSCLTDFTCFGCIFGSIVWLPVPNEPPPIKNEPPPLKVKISSDVLSSLIVMDVGVEWKSEHWNLDMAGQPKFAFWHGL